MKYYAVLDTNVLVSYFLTHNQDSPIVKIISAVHSGQLVPMYDDAIAAEYVEVLTRERFGLNREEVLGFIDRIKQAGINCSRKPVSEVFPDADDVVFYEVAMSREDSYLVTGNLRHFPKNGRVVSPSDMLQIIEFGELRTGILNDNDTEIYSSISLAEINAIIAEVRAGIVV
jgi:predicted nucleic acid-binding protein